MKRQIQFLFLAALGAVWCISCEVRAKSVEGAPLLRQPVAVPQFKTGDRWCAVGDSITHNGAYHRYVYLFYATRFPDRTIELFDCGISGDTAAGGVKRCAADILRHKPTVATLMFGMNDVGRNLYETGKVGPEIAKQRQARLDAYVTNMKRLVGMLKAANVRLIFLTPSIFDQTAELPQTNLPGVNDALGRCANEVRKLAAESGGTVVDFHGPMGEINLREQKSDPHFTLTGPDRVHPGPVGHFVMAYLFLKAQGVPREVSDITLDTGGRDEVTYTRLEKALPFPVDEACRPALKLVPFVEDMNQQRLRATGLRAGNYTLLIDDEEIASFSAEELGAGVNLAEKTNTPQYRQALEVAKLDTERHELVRGPLRTIDYVEWKLGREIGDTTPFDYDAAANKALSGAGGNPWIKGQFESYLKVKPKQRELSRRLDELVAQIRAASNPKPHRFTLRREAKSL